MALIRHLRSHGVSRRPPAKVDHQPVHPGAKPVVIAGEDADAWAGTGSSPSPAGNTSAGKRKARSVAQLPARGPRSSPREPATVITRELQDGRSIALREDGSARLGAVTLQPGLSLAAHGDLACLQQLAPLHDERGPLLLLRGSPRDRLVRVAESQGQGPVEGSGGALFVMDGRFCVARGPLLYDEGGGLLGVLRPGEPPTPLRLTGTPTLLRTLSRALRDDGVLRLIDGEQGAQWHSLDGFVVRPDGSVAAQQLSLGATPTQSRGLYEDGQGKAWLVELDRGGARQTLRVTPAPEGPMSSASASPGCSLAVLDGRLVLRDDARPGLAFTMEGAPWARTDGKGFSAGEVVEGRTGGRYVAVTDEAGRVSLARVEHSVGDEHMVHVDGRALLVSTRGHRREGALGDPPALIVEDGRALQVISSSHGGRRLLARGEGRTRVFDLKRRGALLELRPREARGEAFPVRRGGSLEEVVLDGQSFSVARAPRERTALGRDLLAVLDTWTLGERGMITELGLSRAAARLCAAARALLDDASFQPAVSEPRARREALATEVAAGAGPWVEALGGMDHLERVLGFVRDDDLVVAFRDGGARVRRTPGSFQGPGAAHQLALFRIQGDEVLPLDVTELQARFDAVVPSVSASPAPTNAKVRVELDASGQAALRVEAGGVERSVDVAGAIGPDHPPLAQVASWLAALPAPALAALEHLRFGPPDPNGQAKFAPATGTLTYAATPGFWAEQGQTTTVHELVGHGLEQSDPRVLRALAMARVLDGVAGHWVGTRDPYGDTNLAESFAVGVQELFAPPPLDSQARGEHPAFARLVDALLQGALS